MEFVYLLSHSLSSWSVRYSNRKSKEYRTNTFIQHSIWSLSMHSYCSLFSGPVRYLNRKSDEYRPNKIMQQSFLDFIYSLLVFPFKCVSAGFKSAK